MGRLPALLRARIPLALHVRRRRRRDHRRRAGFLLPRFAPYVVAGWLGGIILNLVIISAAPGGHAVFWDIALRDLGLLLAALALARLAATYAPNPFRRSRAHEA